MYITSEQMRLISDTYGIRVHYSPIWKKMQQIGFCYKDHDGYHVKIDKELSKDVKKVVLIHELGHIDLDHLKVDEYKEKEIVDDVIEKVGAPKDLINRKLNGGFHDFMNICFDLEVNSKFLTFENYSIMKDVNFPVLNIEDWNMDYQSDYRGYYEPVIFRLMKEKDCQMAEAMDKLRDWAKSMEESEKRGQGEGKMIPGGGGNQSDPSDENKDGEPSNTGNGGSESDSDVKTDKDFHGKSGDSNKSGNKPDRKSNGGGLGDDDKDDSKGEGGSDKDESSTVKNEFKEDIDNQNRAPHKGYSSAYSNDKFELTNKTSIKLREFLSSLISRQNTRMPDSMRLYNRGIRRNPQGLLYTSTRTKRNKDQMKLGILIDVSGSMELDDISAAINSLGELKLSLDPRSKVVLWSTDLNQEWPITDPFPRNPCIGGGTDMLAGIKYLINDGFTDIVVYSDWETSCMDVIIDLAGSHNMYGIFVCSDMKDKYNVSLCKNLKKWMEIH